MRRYPILALLAVLLVSIPIVAVLWLWPAGGSEVEANMAIGARTYPDGRVDLDIDVRHLQPGVTYTVRIAAPDEADASVSVGVLGQFEADSSGMGRLATSAATLAAGVEVPLTMDLFVPPGRTITVVSATGETVAEMQQYFLEAE
jgi:hypothetical protein